jgi:hypothetical protein
LLLPSLVSSFCEAIRCPSPETRFLPFNFETAVVVYYMLMK